MINKIVYNQQAIPIGMNFMTDSDITYVQPRPTEDFTFFKNKFSVYPNYIAKEDNRFQLKGFQEPFTINYNSFNNIQNNSDTFNNAFTNYGSLFSSEEFYYIAFPIYKNQKSSGSSSFAFDYVSEINSLFTYSNCLLQNYLDSTNVYFYPFFIEEVYKAVRSNNNYSYYIDGKIIEKRQEPRIFDYTKSTTYNDLITFMNSSMSHSFLQTSDFSTLIGDPITIPSTSSTTTTTAKIIIFYIFKFEKNYFENNIGLQTDSNIKEKINTFFQNAFNDISPFNHIVIQKINGSDIYIPTLFNNLFNYIITEPNRNQLYICDSNNKIYEWNGTQFLINNNIPSSFIYFTQSEIDNIFNS